MISPLVLWAGGNVYIYIYVCVYVCISIYFFLLREKKKRLPNSSFVDTWENTDTRENGYNVSGL